VNWEWEPGIGLGPFRFGAALPASTLACPIVDLGWGDDGTGWESFGVLAGAFTVHVEAECVVACDCWQRVEYRGCNLVGLTPDQLAALLGVELSISQVAPADEALEAEALGASFWFAEGRVQSVTVNRIP